MSDAPHQSRIQPSTLFALGSVAIAGAVLWWTLGSGAADERTAAAARETPGGVVARLAQDMEPLAPVNPGDHASVTHRGVAFQINTYYRAVETYTQMTREIADLGANTLLIGVAGHMEHARAQAIFVDSRKVPPPAELKQILQAARERGLYVIFMPIVLLSNPRGSEWRGVIEPPDWPEWWKSYEEFICYFADIAREGGADAMMVGSELVTTEKYTERWKPIIAKVRERFPGKLGYSANWDHYEPVTFWDQLDFVGMTSYYTLADGKSPSVQQIVEKWKPIREEITNWAREVGKPLYLTEVGWCSQEGAAQAPWNYYQNQRASAAGHEEQRRLYEAFLRAWATTPELRGVIWWEWTPGNGGPDDYGYTPKGKPAEAVIREWFKGGRSQ